MTPQPDTQDPLSQNADKRCRQARMFYGPRAGTQEAFQRRYEQTAAPFDWQFTRSDLDGLLRRLEEHEHPPRTA